MFKIPGHDPFMTTIGKLNFFRWALETKILDYIETHQDEIRTGYNVYLKETIQNQKRNKSESTGDTEIQSAESSPSSTASNEDQLPPPTIIGSSSSIRTTRRRTKQTPSSLNKLQVYTTPIVLDFN
jgi:hypothetical protein